MLTKDKELIRECRFVLEQIFRKNIETYIDLFFYEKEVILELNQAEILGKAGILTRDNESNYAKVMIFPFKNKFIVTDFLLSIRKMLNGRYIRGIDDVWVMFPHETLLFIDRLKESGETALDLASGSGAISLFLADQFNQVFSLDINPKAIQYAKFNAMLNGVENKIVNLHSDMFANIKDRKFDFICWNGPTVAMPEIKNAKQVYPLYTYGGHDGAEFTKRFLSEVLEYTEQKFKIKWWDGSLGTEKESVVIKFIKDHLCNEKIKITVDYLNKRGGTYLSEYDKMYEKYCLDKFDLNQNAENRKVAVKSWYNQLKKERLNKVYISIITIEPSEKFELIEKYPTKTYVSARRVLGFEWHYASRKFIKNYLLEQNP